MNKPLAGRRCREVSVVSIGLHGSANISHLIGTIVGPANSRYEVASSSSTSASLVSRPVLLRSAPPPPSRTFLSSYPPSASPSRRRPSISPEIHLHIAISTRPPSGVTVCLHPRGRTPRLQLQIRCRPPSTVADLIYAPSHER